MKTIGLIGGMSWESSALYYRIINELVQKRFGGLHSCKILMYSADFAEIDKMQKDGEWNELSRIMADIGVKLETGGAECLAICCNTMHKVAEELERKVAIPLIHIADAAGSRIQQSNLRKVGLLGTKFTMEQDFYKQRLASRYGIEVMVPSKPERESIHSIIYSELVAGIINQASREKFRRIIRNLCELGAEGIILGCTEFPLLIRPEDSPVPLFNTTQIHAEAIVDFI
jgi:aspartate racemase